MGLPTCLSKAIVVHTETPGLALMRQQRGGNNEVAWLAPLVTMGTSLTSCGKFSDDESEGRKDGQRDGDLSKS